MTISPVAVFHSPIGDKFGVPRQAGLAPALPGEVRFLPPYDAPEAVRCLEGFDYCWLVWGFSLNEQSQGSLTVRPPRLGGNKRVGVFASRSPFRPNGLGLSCVRIESVGNGVLRVSGADLADGTPVYDVKPYVEYADSRPGVRSGFVDASVWEPLDVEIPAEVAGVFDNRQLAALRQVLSQDPRPQYQDDPQRVYGLLYCGRNVRFRVDGGKLYVLTADFY